VGAFLTSLSPRRVSLSGEWASPGTRSAITTGHGAEPVPRLQKTTYNKIADHATKSTDMITEWIQALKKCVQRLGEHDRRIVLMRYKQNIALRKIAELTQRTPGGLYKTMARIHNRLRDCVRLKLAALEAGYD